MQPLAPRPSPLDMGREDVPTRGSDWFVYLEFCVGVIYGIGWFRVVPVVRRDHQP